MYNKVLSIYLGCKIVKNNGFIVFEVIGVHCCKAKIYCLCVDLMMKIKLKIKSKSQARTTADMVKG